jgi:DNA-binding PadR family transcriptional regulator
MEPTVSSIPPAQEEIERLLPLKPVEFHVLLSVAAGPRHGYGIMQDAAERTGREIIPDVGTLYRALRRMVDRGLIVPTGDSGARRNDYRITPLGRRLAKAESRRLASLVRAARAGGLLGREG